MKKSVGIITIVKVGNYGAELQAYATLKKLLLLGFDAELIDYIYYKTWYFKDTNNSRPFYKRKLADRIKYIIKYRIINWFVDKIFPCLDLNVRRRNLRFQKFHDDNTRFSEIYDSFDKLYSNPPFYDIYLAGSDQIWNPSSSSSIQPYFLTFSPKGKRRVTYASSFGISEIPKDLSPIYREWLNGLDYISVREINGKEIISKLSNINVKVVVDPTLLLNKEEWMSVSREYPHIPKRYILIYLLFHSDPIIELAQRISREKKIPVYRITKRAFGEKNYNNIKNIKDAGPAEFLSLVANAECVITNSFHGTAFSINFNVPFYTILSKKRKNNSRIISLLESIEAKDRIKYEEDMNFDIELKELSDSQLKNLSLLKEESLSYLVQSLQ